MLRRLSDHEMRVRPLPAGDEVAPRCELVLDGRPTDHRVSGAVLQAGLSCGDGRLLLFLTDGVPQEDRLSVLLLGPDLALLDGIELQAMYATQAFAQLRLQEPDRVRFQFNGEFDWQVRLLPAARATAPAPTLAPDPPGVQRLVAGAQRHFCISTEPRSASVG